MNRIALPSSLPQAKLITELALKSASAPQLDFFAPGLLDEFRRLVSQQVRFIQNLFPEYTPHDEQYHLSRLFDIADKVLGVELIEKLNFSELFILCLALYGHDWGMAVSTPEKELIVNNRLRDGHQHAEFSLLGDEQQRWKQFLADHSVQGKETFPAFLWPEYVRETHALRSAARVRDHFQRLHAGLGEAVARVCEAHWLDFKYLEDNELYPVDYGLFGQTVNLKALSIYVRLIDLLDISGDRTPYIIWKFVAPENDRSKMEWDKHRAILSVLPVPYQDGRVIRVDGSTPDHAVYAALKDLELYCADQLQGCNDLLNQINMPNYNLNLFAISWRIKPDGFKPVSVQFQFSRTSMFDILSEEIYQGDKHVFIRELLQNSIDAVKLRREILERRAGLRTELYDFGLIEINVDKFNNGDEEITVSDNGIGMDEYIIKNYLSVVGKSYYTSEDFRKLDLRMDPISKFGVGILSCFMVADRIAIETCREPYLSSHISPEKLSILVPSVTQQFRVQVSQGGYPIPGTKVLVYVSADKLADDRRGNAINELQVTEYVARVAGFAPFPIKIRENGVTTVVVGPYANREKLPDRFPGCGVRQLSFRYPWEVIFEPQSLEYGKKWFGQKMLDLREDLKMEGVSGKIIFPEPLDEQFLYKKDFRGTGNYVINGVSVKSKNGWSSYAHGGFEEAGPDLQFEKSAAVRPQYRVYLDGILVPNLPFPSKFEHFYLEEEREDCTGPIGGYQGIRHFYTYFLPYFIVNFSRSSFKSIDLSRTQLVKKEKWEEGLWQAYVSYIRREYIPKLLQASPKERLFLLAQLALYKRIGLENVSDLLPLEKFVVPVIENGGTLAIKEWSYFMGRDIYLQPDSFYHFDKVLLFFVEGEKKKKEKYDDWKGDEFIYINTYPLDDKGSSLFLLVSRLANIILPRTHVLRSIRFPGATHKELPPMVQKICTPLSPGLVIDQGALVRKSSRVLNDLSPMELNTLVSVCMAHLHNWDIAFPSITYFEKPYEKSFAYGGFYFNFHHPNVKFLLQLSCYIAMHADCPPNAVTFGDLTDCLGKMHSFSGSSHKMTIVLLNAWFNEALGLAKSLGWDGNCFVVTELTMDDFIKHSIRMESWGLQRFDPSETYLGKTVDLEGYSKSGL